MNKTTIVLIVLGFLVVVGIAAAATLPATVALNWAADQAELEYRGARGTIWAGSAALTLRGHDLGTVRWDTDGWSLLRLQVAADVEMQAPLHTARGRVTATGQGIEVADAEFTADAALLSDLAIAGSGTLLGQLAGRIEHLEVDANGGIVALVGAGRWTGAGWRSDIIVPLSDLELVVPAAEQPLLGAVRDLGGPLAVTGDVEFGGRRVATRLNLFSRGSDPRVEEALYWIGQPNGEGGRYLELTSVF